MSKAVDIKDIFVFSEGWFAYHQSKILKLANSWLGRKVLRISKDIPKNRKITSLTPNSFTWVSSLKDGNPVYSTDFRTEDKFAKRLYNTFKPFWYMLHFLDWVFSYNPVPQMQLNFGFDTLTVYPAQGQQSPVDGSVKRLVSEEAFNTLRASAGTGADDTGMSGNAGMLKAGTTTDLFTEIGRGIFLFDTSALPDGTTITGATFSLWLDQRVNTLGLSDSEAGLALISSNPASDSALVAADYQQFGSTRLATDIPYSSWGTGDYTDFTLNGSGIAAISKTGLSKFGTKLAIDLDGGTPNWVSGTYVKFSVWMADLFGIDSDPKLIIEYGIPAQVYPESVGIGDAVEMDFVKGTISETITAADDMFPGEVAEVEDSMGIAAVFEYELTKHLPETGIRFLASVGFNDELGPLNFEQTVEESFGISDVIETSMNYVRTIEGSIEIGDVSEPVRSLEISDSIGISDEVDSLEGLHLQKLVESSISTDDAIIEFVSQTRLLIEESIGVKDQLNDVGWLATQKTGITPLWILKVEFATGTIYLSDQTFYIDAFDATTKAWVKTWNELDMDIGSSGLSLITASDISLDLINDQDDANNLDTLLWHASNKPEATDCKLYLWMGELMGTATPPVLFWSGNFVDYPKKDELTYSVQLVDSSMRFEYNVGDLLETTTYPNADPDDIGKTIPVIYGDVKNVPALAIDAGWVTTIAENINASVTSFDITDGTGLSNGDTIQTEDEKILIGTVSGNALSGCTRGYSSTTATTHDKGIQLGKVQSEYWYLLADHPVKSIGDVYVDGVRQVGTDFVKYPDDGGKAKIKFTALPVLKKSVDVEVDDNVKVQDYAVSHNDGINQDASKLTNQNLALKWDWTSGFSTSQVKSIAQFNHPGYSYSEATYSVSCKINIWATTSDVTVYARLNTVASGQGGGTVGTWVPIMFWRNDGTGFSYYNSILQTFPTISSGISYLEVKVTSGNPSGVSYFKTVSVTRTIKANASVVGTGVSSKVSAVKAKTSGSKPYYIGLTGNSSADMVIGTQITANVQGYEDDGSGTYTGTPNALIERPDHVFKHFLDVYGGVTNFITAAGSSFSSKGYKFAGVINIQKPFKEWLASFAWQCRSYFRFSMDYAELVFRPDSLSSTIDITDELIVASGENSSLKGPAPSPLDEVLNVIDLRYNKDWSNRDEQNAYKGLEPVSDTTSITRYGKKEQTELFYFDFITDSAMAASLAAYYLARYKDRKREFELDVMLDLISVTFGVGITLDPVSLLCEVKKVNIYPGSGQDERNDQIHLIVREW